MNEEFWPHRYYVNLVVLFIGVLMPLWLFGSVAEDVVEHDVFFFDWPILLFLHSHASPLLDSVMVFFSKSGSALVLIPFNVMVFAILMWRCSSILLGTRGSRRSTLKSACQTCVCTHPSSSLDLDISGNHF